MCLKRLYLKILLLDHLFLISICRGGFSQIFDPYKQTIKTRSLTHPKLETGFLQRFLLETERLGKKPVSGNMRSREKEEKRAG